MKTKKRLTEKTAKRYCRASKKEKTKIIDEFTATTGYNRKYAVHVLKNSAQIRITSFNNVRKESIHTVHRQRRKRVYVPIYGSSVRAAIIRLWRFSTYLCAKRLVPFIRDNIDYLAGIFNYSPEPKSKLSRISSATTGRILKPEISRNLLRGISTTRPAKNLNALIPIRVFFDWDERKPGFFEIDTVANCGLSTSGQYISTLTLTDVHSGWTENRALLNKAQRRVKEAVEDVRNCLPFAMKGIDSDNGSELKIRYFSGLEFEGQRHKKPVLFAHPATFKSITADGYSEIGSILSESILEKFFKMQLKRGPQKITDRLLYLGEIPRNTDFEGKQYFGKKENETDNDYVVEDTALVYQSSQGLIIITGCSHSGICNITEYAKKLTKESRILDIIGGFHLLNPSDIQMQGTLEYLKNQNIKRIHPCHCTDLKFKIMLAGVVSVEETGSGMQLEYEE